MNRKQWALLAIAAARGAPVSPAQLQKSLFLLGKNLTPEHLMTSRFYTFKPYDYGPFNKAIYEHAEELQREGLISIHSTGSYRRYTATVGGLQEAERLRAGLDAGVTGYLDRVVAWVRRIPFHHLVREIYRLYPAMAERTPCA